MYSALVSLNRLIIRYVGGSLVSIIAMLKNLALRRIHSSHCEYSRASWLIFVLPITLITCLFSYQSVYVLIR
jgi:hypothetical protein